MKAGILAAMLWVSAALALEPSLSIPGAVRVERSADGSERVALADGSRAWVTPTRDGYFVRYSDQRPGEWWTKTRSGYAVTSLGRSTNVTTQRIDESGLIRTDGSRARIDRTRDGMILRDTSGTTTWWTTNRNGAIGYRVER